MSSLPTITDLVQLEYENKRLDEEINNKMMGEEIPWWLLTEKQFRELKLKALSRIINGMVCFYEIKKP